MMSITVSCLVPEGVIATDLSHLQDHWKDIEIGSYPFYKDGKFGTSIVMRGFDLKDLEMAAGQMESIFESKGGSPMRQL